MFRYQLFSSTALGWISTACTWVALPPLYIWAAGPSPGHMYMMNTHHCTSGAAPRKDGLVPQEALLSPKYGRPPPPRAYSNLSSVPLNTWTMGSSSHWIQGCPKKRNIGIFKLHPKIVVMQPLGSPKMFGFSLILQKWPRALHYNFWVRAQRKAAQNGPKSAFF